MVREQVGVIFHWLQDRIGRKGKLSRYQAKQQHRWGLEEAPILLVDNQSMFELAVAATT